MASAGFSAQENLFGTITGLTAVSSERGTSASLAEAQNSSGDVVASDVYGETDSPKVSYKVTGDDPTLPALGSVVTSGTKKYMVTGITITTGAAQEPTVEISGSECETNATAGRTFALGTLSLKKLPKAQDVCGALTASPKFTSITTTFTANFVPTTVAGAVVASSISGGKVEVSATMADYDGAGSITALTSGGFTITTPETDTRSDTGYIERTATLTKYLTATEPSAS